MDAGDPHSDTFRDSLANVTREGKRIWIYPRKQDGRYYRWRTWLSWLYLAIFFIIPFIRLNGRPFVLLNIPERHFILFGMPFWPQDFDLFVMGMLALILFIVLFTLVFGRLWCGWACPQTVFMEMLFRKIERLIEGNSKKLDAAPWTTNKILRKSTKFVVFFLLSFLIANTFLSYIIGTDELFKIITDSPADHIGGLIAILLFTSVFYAVFAHLRELVCTLICPYGRLQGVLMSRNTMQVSYDYKRGEPRVKASQKGGDCVDCTLCVQVCPTGIDIRNGSQLECVHCMACMDACDTVMAKLKRPQGLIRLDSKENIESGKPFRLTTSIKLYSLLLLALVGGMIALMLNRTPVETTVLRAPGMLYQQVTPDTISNLYNIELVNKTFNPMDATLKLVHPGGRIQLIGKPLQVEPGDITKASFFIQFHKKDIRQTSTPLDVEIWSGDKRMDKAHTTFTGPVGGAVTTKHQQP